MSGVLKSIPLPDAIRAIAGKCLVIGLAAMLAACSGSVSRFDYTADTSLTTGSLTPVPAEPVYANGTPVNSTAVVRQDLPPPQYNQQPYQQPQSQQYAAVQPAPLPPRAQAPYTAPRPVQTQAIRMQPVAPPQPVNRTIKVKRGDTLSSLAREHGVSVEDIKSASNLKSTRLSIDQELTIPGPGAPASSAKTVASTYTVKRGDSIARIARMHDVSNQELQRANDITNPNTLQPGQVLKIPGQAAASASAPVRVASRGANVPLPTTNPARTGTAPKPSGSSISSARPQQKVAARTKDLPQPEPMTGNQFRWPVKGRIVAGFGPRASGKHNDGINVAVPKGTSIKAAENGVVAYAGSELEPYGNLILIRHANNWVTAYAHNDELIVKRGDTVRRGQVIAKAGQSGNVSQPQLHFELRKGSKPVNPLSYMASNS